MNRFILFILLASSFLVGYSQRTAKVAATYTYYAPETMSVEEAKRVALDRAKIQAIADEFGTIVSQSTSTVITNKNGESDTQFFALGGSDVKGEWIETIGNPEYQLKFDNHFLLVTCSVKGKAKEITQSRIDIIVKPLRNGTTLKYESVEFKDGDDLYLYFKSPIEGFLSVYLLDQSSGNAYQILPYRRSNGNPYKIIKDKEYIWFSKSAVKNEERALIDEYRLNCTRDTEYNTLITIFSPEYFSTAICNEGDVSIPNFVSKELFMKWLTSFKSKNVNYSIVENILTIKQR